MNIKCFIDSDGFVWSIDHKGKSNYPQEIRLSGNTVQVLGGFEDEARLIEEEYTLHPSLTSLAMAIEQTIRPSSDGAVSLDQAVAEAHLNAEAFKAEWVKQHKENPISYPMSISADNAGIWHEQLVDFGGIEG